MPISLTGRGDGFYSGTYTPAAAGPVTLSITAVVAGRAQTRTVSGIASQTALIAPGGPSVTVTASSPGENPRVRFDGVAGQRVSLKLSAVTISGSYVSLLKPDGSPLGNSVYVGSGGGFVDTVTLPSAGGYTILVDPQGTATGSITLTLYEVPADTAATISPGGAALTITTTTPGQNARIRFDGQSGQRVSLKLSALTISGAYVSILKPDGNPLGNLAYIGGSGGFIDTTTLPSTGGYTILVDPQGAATGSITLTLYAVPADLTGTITIGGPALTLTLATPGQNARIQFDGQAGQRLNLKLSALTITGSYVSILKPDGNPLVSPAYFTTAERTIVADLPAAGTYTIVLDPYADATGSATLTLTPG